MDAALERLSRNQDVDKEDYDEKRREVEAVYDRLPSERTHEKSGDGSEDEETFDELVERVIFFFLVLFLVFNFRFCVCLDSKFLGSEEYRLVDTNNFDKLAYCC